MEIGKKFHSCRQTREITCNYPDQYSTRRKRKINFLDFTTQPLKEDSKGYLDIDWSLQNNTNKLNVNESKPDRFHFPSRKWV